jgi:DNA-binding NtrC family response regulator
MSLEGRQVLLVDPAREVDAQAILRSLGAQVSATPDAASALGLASRVEFDLAIVDVGLAGQAENSLLGRLRAEAFIPSILVLATRDQLGAAIESLGRGADDYLIRPIDRAEALARAVRLLMWQQVDDRVLQLQKEMTRKYVLGNLVCRSQGMRRVRDQINQVAPVRSTVLILGESGVGKELVAKAIHYNSPRREGPFIAINCSAIPVNLIESELFGHERGAFTGAVMRQKGKFELSHGGTIFLDEIGEMDLSTQAKLLRVLEEREFMRVGGGREIRVDVRVLAATNSDPEQLISRGRFRDDLYFRLKVITIRVPPLRERQEDIPDLVRTFLGQISRENGLRPMRLTRKAMRALLSYSWPGNVRELKNVLESTAITRPGEVIRASGLPRSVRGDHTGRALRARAVAGMTLREMERELIRRTLAAHGGNRTRAARALRIGVRTLQRKIKTYDIRIPFTRTRPASTRQRLTATPRPGLSSNGRM